LFAARKSVGIIGCTVGKHQNNTDWLNHTAQDSRQLIKVSDPIFRVFVKTEFFLIVYRKLFQRLVRFSTFGERDFCSLQ
jgi:hypothetical protein